MLRTEPLLKHQVYFPLRAMTAGGKAGVTARNKTLTVLHFGEVLFGLFT